MGVTQEQLQQMAAQIDHVIDLIQQQDLDNGKLMESVCPIYRESAKNLIHYAAFRSFDARKMQKGLKELGFTRLANAEGNILGSLINLKVIVNTLLGGNPDVAKNKFLSIGEGTKILKKHTNELFGKANK